MAHAASAGLSPSTSSIATTSPNFWLSSSDGPSASSRLPSRTESWMTATAAGVPRSSSIASRKASGIEANHEPTTGAARSRKSSMRRNALADSSSASKLNSTCER